MGQSLELKDFTNKDHRKFSKRLNVQLEQLREQIKKPSFSSSFFSLGAELEVYLVDEKFEPACINEQILELANNSCFTPEINRYNLELNLTPVNSKGVSPFALMEQEMRQLLDELHGYALDMGSRVIPVGILPTLKKCHLTEKFMTDQARYHALKRGLCGEGHKNYRINIDGKDPLVLEGKGISVEGANTSFQVHLRVPADRFADYFNGVQLTAPLLLALSANSPLVIGHRLWQESRIALFKQSIDFRDHGDLHWRQPARVSFGQGWVRKEAWELFAENVALYEPLIPVLYDEADSSSLSELRLHHGTVWSWNRAVYAPGEDGHLRIEFRSLPAGPTVLDMLANGVFAIGLTLGFADVMDHYTARLPFRFAEYNFYRGAQQGLEAKLVWPNRERGCLEERSILDIIEEFLPIAREGLKKLESNKEDIDRLWKIVEERFEKQITGARWQIHRFEYYRQKCSVEESCYRMLGDYQNNMMTDQPVVSWC